MTDKNKARVFHFDLHGKREEKYEFHNNQSIESIPWAKLEVKEPGFFFVEKRFEIGNEYSNGFNIDELFTISTSGIKTHNDNQLVGFNKFQNNNQNYFYRPFDIRFIEFDLQKVVRHRISVMKHFLQGNNLALISCRQQSSFNFQHCFICDELSDINSISLQTKEISFVFPLYLYPESKSQTSINQTVCRTPNLNQSIVNQIAAQLNLTFTSEKETSEGSFAPIDLLDYIYAVLHNPTYRAKYKEFLKIDFPRVPYPKNPETFWQLAKLGGELRQIHLLESPVVEKFITTYPNDGSNQVIKIFNEDNKVRINDQQYFDHVPPVAWNFYIGGYQPAQKWLKDRKGRMLSFDDIMHYQKIIVALSETDRIMKEIDGVIIE
jgi:predicted helicase